MTDKHVGREICGLSPDNKRHQKAQKVGECPPALRSGLRGKQMGLLRDIQRRRARGERMRPLWQIPLMMVALPLYWLASAYVDWMDGK